MDGIPGVTQDAVEPGKSFTYEFEANVPGTYWYHSHQDSVNQLDRGLYGALIVEDTKENMIKITHYCWMNGLQIKKKLKSS